MLLLGTSNGDRRILCHTTVLTTDSQLEKIVGEKISARQQVLEVNFSGIEVSFSQYPLSEISGLLPMSLNL
jgi:hypothetical protein